MTVLSELLESRDGAQKELEGLLHDEKGEERTEGLTEDEESRSQELLASIDEFDGRIEEETKAAEKRALLQRARQAVASTTRSGVQVTHEPMLYGPGSENSYFLDMVRRSQFSAGLASSDGGAGERLGEWQHQVEREVADGSEVGRRALPHIRDEIRSAGQRAPQLLREISERGRASLQDKGGEQRAGITSGGGATVSISGGGAAAVVNPVILNEDYVIYREFGREFANAAQKQTMPDYGLEIYIPAFTGGAGVAQRPETNAVPETDPTLGFRTSAVILLPGQITISQELIDRVGPNFNLDVALFKQLSLKYASVADGYVLSQALANATSQVWSSGTPAFELNVANGAGGFDGQVQKAAATMEETEGTVTSPTHLFLKPSRARYVETFTDTVGRRQVVSDIAGPFNALGAGSPSGDSVYEGDTGFKLGGIQVYKDANLPAPTVGNDQAIVADMRQVWLWESAFNTRAVPQTLAGTLQTILQGWAYIAAVPVYPAAVAAISGTNMTAISYS